MRSKSIIDFRIYKYCSKSVTPTWMQSLDVAVIARIKLDKNTFSTKENELLYYLFSVLIKMHVNNYTETSSCIQIGTTNFSNKMAKPCFLKTKGSMFIVDFVLYECGNRKAKEKVSSVCVWKLTDEGILLILMIRII